MAGRRRTHAEGHAEGGEERWLLTYSDMITLLMAFFIVLYAISNTDLRKFTALAQSVSAAFNVDVLQGTQALTVTSGQNVAPDAGTFDSGSGAVSTDYRAIRAGLEDLAVSLGVQDRVSVSETSEGILIRIGGSLLFESGRAVLDPTSTQLLDRIAELIRPLPNHVRVEGHTDNVPPDGFLFPDNWALSAARARAVLDGLVARGVDPARLSTEAFAQYEPIASNDTEAGREKNRRVDIVLLYPAATGSPVASDSPADIPTIKP